MKSVLKIVLPLVAMFVLNSAYAQERNQELTFIKTQYAEINGNLKTFRKGTVEDTAETTEGNEVSKYFDGNELKKIKAVYYGETGKAIKEYYFNKNELIFYYEAEYEYTVPINIDITAKIKTRREERYYFKNGNIFMAKVSSKPAISPSEYNKISKETRKEARRLINLK